MPAFILPNYKHIKKPDFPRSSKKEQPSNLAFLIFETSQ